MPSSALPGILQNVGGVSVRTNARAVHFKERGGASQPDHGTHSIFASRRGLQGWPGTKDSIEFLRPGKTCADWLMESLSFGQTVHRQGWMSKVRLRLELRSLAWPEERERESLVGPARLHRPRAGLTHGGGLSCPGLSCLAPGPKVQSVLDWIVLYLRKKSTIGAEIGNYGGRMFFKCGPGLIGCLPAYLGNERECE